MSWQNLFYLVELLNIHEIIKICFFYVFDEVWLLVIHVYYIQPPLQKKKSPK